MVFCARIPFSPYLQSNNSSESHSGFHPSRAPFTFSIDKNANVTFFIEEHVDLLKTITLKDDRF